ncbi:Prephenate dehydratase [Acaryochloris thomasi RCC1774]|uniref:Prephenate dehydratase n=1 Tax=Acaryochloris thomasi RCC1774 TaxID=1764569 RepID=A0A2W1JBN3_9CYAN|nr:prephenate dehydratase [Acaryochloris thomasi]PZD71439.1 Prephenate dehydratase [Acaryochloris thomasi RCC1774]
MTLSIAHLGPPGTYAEQAALAYLDLHSTPSTTLRPYASIARTIQSTAQGETHLTIAPIENSIEGSVATTLDTLWQCSDLQIRQALVLPIRHVLIAQTPNLQKIKAVYSHPQALGQCQRWLATNLPQTTAIATNSTTEALQYVQADPSAAAISSERAAQLYELPIVQRTIQDHPDNCTRFWVINQQKTADLPPVIETDQTYTSLAFSLPANQPGALLKTLQIFAERSINLSRIESRPSRRSMGDYVFFIDAEISAEQTTFHSALEQLQASTEVLKSFGSYPLVTIS